VAERGRAAWTGERESWLRALQRELSERGCSVVLGGDHDAWDLAAARGPLVRLRITTAVAWGWTPLHRLRVRPRAASVVASAGVAAAFLVQPWAAVALAAALAVAAGLELVLLLRAARASIKATTPPAPSPEERGAPLLELARAAPLTRSGEAYEIVRD
jgi:hypothetical protein